MKDHFNYCIAYGKFPDELKHADIIPIQKRMKFDKTNYAPLSILTNISKVYEKWMCNQISIYLDTLLVTNQCRFRKGFSSQYCLLVMLEKFKEAIDRGNQFGRLLNRPFETF